MSSVREIARLAGVSITTVSRALNNDGSVKSDTRERILALANKKGYFGKVGRRVTTNIAFAYTGEPTLMHPYDSSVLAGVARGVDEAQFDVVVLNMQRDKRADETFTQFFMRKGVRGVILRTMQATRDSCEAISDEGFPHVVISERFDREGVNFIDCNSRPDSQRAVDYLLSLGHRRIAYGMHNEPDRDHLDRYAGYCDALHGAGVDVDDRLVFRQPYTLAGGASILQVCMSMPNRPTAIYLADPMMGVGAIKRAHEMGVRVPEDISIVGFDDTQVRYSVHPTMTAVCQNAAALGYEAALFLTRLLASGGVAPLRKAMPTYFEVHESTAAPHAPAFNGNGSGSINVLQQAEKSRAAAVPRSADTPESSSKEVI